MQTQGQSTPAQESAIPTGTAQNGTPGAGLGTRNLEVNDVVIKDTEHVVSTKTAIAVVGVIAIVMILACGIFLFYTANGPTPQDFADRGRARALAEVSSLGANIYKASSNPLEGKSPETVSPVSNPLDDAYINPFN